MLRSQRTISVPIILGIISLCLSIALLIGWILVIAKNLSLTQQTVQNTWLLILGSVSFAVIITVVLLLSVFLAREISLSNRQTRFIDSVTHELKSPLASITLCLETLEREDEIEELLYAISVPIVGFLLYYVAMLAAIALQWQQHETSILVSRGVRSAVKDSRVG